MVLLSAACAALAGQAGAQASTAATSLPSVFEGRASWYGEEFKGRPTASGEIYDPAGMTAAHRSLPFGTMLRVTDRASGASVVVRVNDRGPFVGDRIIDLSEAAARLIGLVKEGTGWVSCVLLSPAEAAAFGAPLPPGGAATAASPGTAASSAKVADAERVFRIQVGSYRDRRNATATVERLRLSGIAATIEVAGAYNRVVIAPVAAADEAVLAGRLRGLGYRELLISSQ